MSFNDYYYIREAFQEKDMQKAVGLIKSYLEKNIGSKLYQKHGVDYFKNSKGSGEGLRYFLEDGRSLRFNFANGQIDSIDIWKPESKDPAVRIETKGLSVATILPFIAKTLEVPKAGKFEVETKEEAVAESFLKEETINVSPGSSETDNNPDVEKEQKKLDNIKMADVKYVYDDLDSLVRLVADGKVYSLLITGMPGTGKTYTTTKILDEYGKEGDFYIHNKGVTTPYALYQTLYNNNDKVIVYDDSDRVLQDKNSISILLAALDNKPERTISWDSPFTFDPSDESEEWIKSQTTGKVPKYPNKFKFTGRIIFITNKSAESINEALRSRSYHIDVTLRREDIIARIRQVMENIQPNVSMELKNKVLAFMEKNQKQMKSNLDLRTFDKAVTIAASGNPNWERLVLKYV